MVGIPSTGVPFTAASTYTLPEGFNISDIIAFSTCTATNVAAVFFRNGSFITTGENPPFTFTTVRRFTLPAGWNASDAIGVEHDHASVDVAMFFRNGSYLTAPNQANYNGDFAFTDVIAPSTYNSGSITGNNLTESTNITLQTRVSNDSVAFTDWSYSYENSSSQPLAATTARYVQYRALFFTPDPYVTPQLENVTINYTDVSPPSINFTAPTPSNNSFLSANFIYINVSIFDGHSIDKCTLEINGANESMLKVRDGRNTTCFINKTSLSEGKYGFRAYANDSFGNANSTETRNVTLDITMPAVELFAIQPNPANLSINNVSVNFTVSDLYLNSTILNVSYPNGTTFTTYNSNFTLTAINLSVPGNYSIRLFANDSAGNSVSSSQNLSVIDVTEPGIILLAPGNNTLARNATVIFYYLPDDNFNITNCTLTLDNRANATNFTVEEDIANNFTLVLPEGVYDWGVNCTDGYLNTNQSETRRITVDINPANITLNFPVNDFNTSVDAINFNWTALDTFDINITCNLTINNAAVGINITNFTSRHANFTAVNLTEGPNFWNVTCMDDANNTNSSPTRNFTIVKGPSSVNITLGEDNESINISWSPASYAESYSIYIIDQFTDEFGPIANASGITHTNFTDTNAGNKTQRFYKIAAVKGSVNKTAVKTIGKYEFELINNSNALSDWNLVSLPLNITNFLLNNGSNNGSDLKVKPLYCIKALWFYNATTRQFKETDYNGSAWIPASGSENFTSLEMGRGYWAEVNQSCNLTFVGEVPASNKTISLETGWNLVGWYSPNSSRLPINFQPPYPIVVNPQNSAKAIIRYNPLIDRFEGTSHFVVGGNDWGWWPSSANKGFTGIEPTKGYYYDILNPATWVHKPNTDK